MNLPESAERLTHDWTERHHTLAGLRDQLIIQFALTQLADPESDYGELLDELCRRRWTAEQVAS
ncbi:MAG: hypothetical protein ACRDQX_02125 [Pseudonocardiaceae bacterium]